MGTAAKPFPPDFKTGLVPIASVTRRLLTGYAVNFNRRHRRSGHPFQNRYKSILCQEDVYLKEMVRHIHLNPLRAETVPDLKALDRYPYGIDLDTVIEAVAHTLSIPPERVYGPSKARDVGRATSLVCFWAVQRLGMTMTAMGKELGMSVSTVSVAVGKGKQLAEDADVSFQKSIKYRNIKGVP